MSFLRQIYNFIVIYNFIKLFALCEFVDLNDFNDDGGINSESQFRPSESENFVLDSVYDTMKHNYEVKLQQDLRKLNIITELRNKRNTNEPVNVNTVSYNDYYKNHQVDVSRKNVNSFPLGFKSPPKLIPITDPMPPAPIRRSDYYDEEVVG
jgi:hypothetical protein